MIAESPNTLLILLAVLTLLGTVMGYCVALIFAKRQARQAIELARLEVDKKKPLAETDRQSASGSVEGLGSSDFNRDNLSADAEESLAQQQARRIHELETEVVSLEDKQRRLRQDFASYKSIKNKELERAKGPGRQWAGAADLPILMQKVESDTLRKNSGKSSPQSSVGQSNTLSHPLSREIDIPALSESELSDSVDELDFDIFGESGGGARGRG